ncbi:MAG: hypothetical protein R3C19_05005 [Planctomycetaceae bacterium]
MKLTGRPQSEIDRALLSRVDFTAGDADQLLVTAALLARFEAWDRAIALCREATDRNPWRSEPWLIARRYADRSSQPEHILWSRIGILKYLWTDDFDTQHAEATETLRELQRSLTAAGNSETAQKVKTELDEALIHDLRIRVEWAGDGDVDLSVAEPGKQTCSFRNKVTKNGGVLLLTGDGTLPKGKRGPSVEEYLCREAPSGQYTITLRLVTGKVITGKVMVVVTQYENTTAEKKTRLPVAVGAGMVKSKSN